MVKIRLSKNNQKQLKLAVCIFGLTLLLINPALAKSAFDLSTAGIGARPMGMGSAYVAIADDASAIAINPAGLGLQKTWGATSMSTKLMERVDYKMIGGVLPTKFGTIGFNYLSATTPAGYLTTTDPSSLTGARQITYGSTVMMLSYGRNLSEIIKSNDRMGNLSVGANLKSISNKFDGFDGSGNGMSLDLGLLFKPNANFSGGIAIQNIGGSMSWKNGANETMPMLTKVGGAYNFNKGTAALDVEFGPATLVHGGLEYRLVDMLSLRAGIDQAQISASETVNNFTTGVGIKVGGVSFDYAYRQDNGLANNSTSYFSISFQPPVPSEKKVLNKGKVEDKGITIDQQPEREGLDGLYNPAKKASVSAEKTRKTSVEPSKTEASRGSILNYYQ